MKIEGFADSKMVLLDGKEVRPGNSQDIHNHSPDGFNWGYTGSGPAQLALAILLENLSDSRAIALYQEFKREVIATLEMDKDFCIELDFDEWLSKRGTVERYVQKKIDVVGDNLDGSF